jgi:two-component system, cell cycle response regulator DivK
MTNKPQALIIEDSPDLNTLFCEALNDAGFVTTGIFDGKVAQQRLKEIVPDVILLDLHLPYVSGADLLVQIREDPRLTDVFVIVASADGTWSNIMSEEADIVLNKPVSFVQLCDLGFRVYQSLSQTDGF